MKVVLRQSGGLFPVDRTISIIGNAIEDRVAGTVTRRWIDRGSLDQIKEALTLIASMDHRLVKPAWCGTPIPDALSTSVHAEVNGGQFTVTYNSGDDVDPAVFSLVEAIVKLADRGPEVELI